MLELAANFWSVLHGGTEDAREKRASRARPASMAKKGGERGKAHKKAKEGAAAKQEAGLGINLAKRTCTPVFMGKYDAIDGANQSNLRREHHTTVAALVARGWQSLSLEVASVERVSAAAVRADISFHSCPSSHKEV